MTESVPNLLIVDDEAVVREYLLEAVASYCGVVRAVEGLQPALQAIETETFDLLLADICMPGATGIDLLALAQQLHWDCAVILMTGHAELRDVVAGVRLHAADLLLKPFTLDTLERSIQKTFRRLQVGRQRRAERDRLTDGLKERTQQLEVTRQMLSESYRSALETLVATLEARERETYAHSFRVRSYALHLAELLHYSTADVARLAYAALLHDIGKVAVPDAILLKPGPLTREEFEVLKTHSAVGESIVRRMGLLSTVANTIRHHHERWDGRGYPDGISGSAIPFGARLFAVADTLDAMTSNRCYRASLSLAAARKEIERCSGAQFDPFVAQVFAKVSDETWADLRLQADQDAHAAIVPNVAEEQLINLFPAPVELFPVIARQ
jgi:putative nucleotidyltransferase with HDIG domain